MEVNENYEELKEGAKSVVQVITSNDLWYALALLVALLVLLKVVDLVFLPFRKKGSILVRFTNACVKIFLIITMGMQICSLIPGVNKFTSQIVLSSSLIVVVLGFVFQEGLSNIVHGFILALFKPFAIGDRISVTLDGETLTGYVKEITARHTVIQNVINSADVIIPNARMDTSVVTNSYFDKTTLSTSFLDLSITYESDLERALAIVRQAVEQNALVVKARQAKEITDPVSVFVRELGENGIALRATVTTMTVEENFAACSEIRRLVIHCFEREENIHFAYPHVHVVPGAVDSTS